MITNSSVFILIGSISSWAAQSLCDWGALFGLPRVTCTSHCAPRLTQCGLGRGANRQARRCGAHQSAARRVQREAGPRALCLLRRSVRVRRRRARCAGPCMALRQHQLRILQRQVLQGNTAVGRRSGPQKWEGEVHVTRASR